MNWLKLIYHIFIRQIDNIRKITAGIKVFPPPLGSMTLGYDDVKIAKKWLRDRSNWFDTKIVNQYEIEFACWNGSKFAFGTMGGRVALSACIHALELKPGDEVILPGYTCVVVPNAFQYAGINLVYSDIELDTYGLDAQLIESKITPKTRAILIHHLYGLVCRDYERVISLAKNHGLRVIEDCAHSTGASFRGIKVGNLGDVAFYSSEQSKVFSTIQGGMVSTNNSAIAKRLNDYVNDLSFPDEEWIDKQLTNVISNYYLYKHPLRWLIADYVFMKYGHKILISTTNEEEAGMKPVHYGRKMPAPIAAIGLNQLSKIDYFNDIRSINAKRWDQWCDENGYRKPLVVEDSKPIFLRYPVLVEPEKKQDTFWAKKTLGVNLGVWFVSNLHPVKSTVKGCPNANSAVQRCVNFPTIL